jgi:hypothetical protein
MRPLLVLVLVLVGVGCGEPAITASLELRVDLPMATGTAAHALVQVRRELGAPFDAGFEEETLGSVPLVGSRIEDSISVLTSDATADLKVRVRFCAMAGCAGEADPPAQRFILRGPFHDGERTLYRMFTGDPAVNVPDPVVVDRCQIRGCVESDLSSYCDLATGMHFCEGSHPAGPAPGAASTRVVEVE